MPHSTATTFKSTPLYGGAIAVDLPSHFGDASTIRQVPDHQEVFVDADGYSSVVFDILEHVEQPTDAAALEYHLRDLVAGTGDSTRVVEQGVKGLEKMSNTSVQTITFVQTPTQRSGRKEPDFVAVHLILLRIKQHTTDIVITVNVPHYPGEYEQAANQEEKTELMKEGDRVAQRILESFEIKDWGLFDG
ncbi:Mog1p/PsbP-like protein [Westerdykella ornata]|uniref:Mog1p/PsbP-like protein n=1 Tax=Westerdykella ornata TaxID=318751 RepID=A0A6A6JQY8_WESOR|nr:Mog1p/PsbP-like protein [Westerdykella ornata]KAF2278513.1 Mog1p/PsbP-like protein [Westerdykella ornata]